LIYVWNEPDFWRIGNIIAGVSHSYGERYLVDSSAGEVELTPVLSRTYYLHLLLPFLIWPLSLSQLRSQKTRRSAHTLSLHP
jgi:hypothetical protein